MLTKAEKMQILKMIRRVILTILLLFHVSFCADTNVFGGLQLSEPDNSTTDNLSFEASRNSLLNLLAKKAPLQQGFYKTAVGEKSNKLYGLVQCRGDITPPGCLNCTRTAITEALNRAPNSRTVRLLYTWCTLHYSDENFFSVWKGSMVGIQYSNVSDDDPGTSSSGYNFMSALSDSAPEQPLMFNYGVLDVGQKGKRYGLVQCNRDIRRSDCDDCLKNCLKFYWTTGKINWGVYAPGCAMWYHDYQFYSNVTIVSVGNARYSAHGKAASGMLIAVLILLFLL